MSLAETNLFVPAGLSEEDIRASIKYHMELLQEAGPSPLSAFLKHKYTPDRDKIIRSNGLCPLVEGVDGKWVEVMK